MSLNLAEDCINFYKNKSQKNLNIFLTPPKDQHFQTVVKINWHGTPLSFHFQSIIFKNEFLAHFPQQWILESTASTSFVFFIYNDKSFALDNNYWNDTNSDCHFYNEKNSVQVCLQRDFIAKKSDNTIHALCKNTVADGFFNLMRWALPTTWIQQHKFLIHSSCILNDKEQALLCLGVSGAGKTTISSFREKKYVLGDDMNLLTIENGEFFVTPSLLGQRFENKNLYGRKFPLIDIFWLQKSEKNKIEIDSDAPSLLHISQSLVNIFWNQLNKDSLTKVQNLIALINQKHTIKKLNFNLKGDIWDYVFRHR